MSALLSSLFTKERPWAYCGQKTRDSLKKKVIFVCFRQFFHSFPPFLCPMALLSRHSLLSHSFLKSDGSDKLSSLFKKDNLEQIAPLAIYKKATISVSLLLLMTKERWEHFVLFHRQIALLFFCSQKMIASLKKLMSEFPTLKNLEPYQLEFVKPVL